MCLYCSLCVLVYVSEVEFTFIFVSCICTFCVCVCVSQKERSDCVYVPVLCGQKCDLGLPGETVRYLKRVRVCESALLWRDDIKLLQLHHRGKLSLTLMRDDVLDRYTHTPTYAHTHTELMG